MSLVLYHFNTRQGLMSRTVPSRNQSEGHAIGGSYLIRYKRTRKRESLLVVLSTLVYSSLFLIPELVYPGLFEHRKSICPISLLHVGSILPTYSKPFHVGLVAA